MASKEKKCRHQKRRIRRRSTKKRKLTKRFYSYRESKLITSNESKATKPQNMSLYQNITYAIFNHGPYPISLNLQVSPNKCNWIDDHSEKHMLEPKASFLLVPNHFLKWIRVTYKSAIPSKHSQLTVYYQAQKY